MLITEGDANLQLKVRENKNVIFSHPNSRKAGQEPCSRCREHTVNRSCSLRTQIPVQEAGDPGLIPGSGRSPGEGNGNPLQYSHLENPMDGEAW